MPVSPFTCCIVPKSATLLVLICTAQLFQNQADGFLRHEGAGRQLQEKMKKKKTKIISVPAFTDEVLWAHATLSLKLDIGTQLACA